MEITRANLQTRITFLSPHALPEKLREEKIRILPTVSVFNAF